MVDVTPTGERGTNGEGRPRLPRVLVGIDGSAAARAAAEFAAREARLRGAELVAVIALEPADLADFDRYSTRRQPKAEIVARAERLATEALSELDTGPWPPRIVVSADAPTRALVDRSGTADLLVVGSRGTGGLRSLLLGSVSLHCALHARCPVTVVHGDPGRPAEPAGAEAVEHRLPR
jgi:nucleotide-binding universal stress UspA family protein